MLPGNRYGFGHRQRGSPPHPSENAANTGEAAYTLVPATTVAVDLSRIAPLCS